MAGMALSAAVVVTVASALSGGSFLPQLGQAANQLAQQLNGALVDPQPGMDLGDALLDWTGADGQGGQSAPGGADGQGGAGAPDPGGPGGPAEPGPADDEPQAAPHLHTWGGWEVTLEATCTAQGSQRRVCSGCGEAQTAPLPALGHSWGSWTVNVPASCTAGGLEQRRCASCGQTETNPLPAAGHDWGEWAVVIQATCTADGEEKRACASCGQTQSNVLPATGHDWSGWRTTAAATCTSSGTRSRTCAHCGQIQRASIPALNHSWGPWDITEATCTADGSQTRTCTRCGEVETQPIPAAGHSWGAQESGADGSVSVSCAACQHTVTLGALGFTYTPPDSTATGGHPAVTLTASLSGADSAQYSVQLSQGWYAIIGPVFSGANSSVVAILVNNEYDLTALPSPITGSVTLTVELDGGALLTQTAVFTLTPDPVGGAPTVSVTQS